MKKQKHNLYKFLFEDKDQGEDATESNLVASGNLRSRQSKDSVDNQIDSLILKYEFSSIDEKKDEYDSLFESIAMKSLKYLLTEQDEDAAADDSADAAADDSAAEDTASEDEGTDASDPAGTEDQASDTPADSEKVPNLNIDKFTKRCVRLISSPQHLLNLKTAIINRIKNFLDNHYGDAYVSEFLNILENEHGIIAEEFEESDYNLKEPDTPFAVGANASGTTSG